MAFVRIEGAVCRDACDLVVGWDLVKQFGQYGRVAHVAGGELRGQDFRCHFVNSDVDFAPDRAFRATMLAGVPRTFALYLDPGAVAQQV